MTTWIQDNGGGTIVISNLGDIDDGGGYYKSPVLWESGDKTKLDGIDTGATDDQTGNEIVTAINDSDGGINADALSAGEVNKLLTANEKSGAGYAYDLLTDSSVKPGVGIVGKAQDIGNVHDLAVDSFQKSSDDLDDISDSATYGRVAVGSIDASGRVTGVHDGAGFRPIGTGSGELALLSSGGRFQAGQLYAKTIALNGSSKFAAVDGTATNLDNMLDGTSYKRVSVTEVKETVIWADRLETRSAGALSTTVTPFVETANSATLKLIIPYKKEDGDQKVKLSALLLNSVGSKSSVVTLDMESEVEATGLPDGSSVVTPDSDSQIGGYNNSKVQIDVSALTAGVRFFIMVYLHAVTAATTASLGNLIISKTTKVIA